MELDKIQITKEPGCKVRLSYSIKPEETEKAYKNRLAAFTANVQIKGFRKGKAPQRMVEEQYKAAIVGDVMDNLIPYSVVEAVKSDTSFNEEKQNIISMRIIKNSEFIAGAPISIEAEVSVTPLVEIKKYKGLPLAKKNAEVKDAQIDEVMNRYRESNASLATVERKAGEGDFVVLDMESKDLDGKPVQVLTGTNKTFLLTKEKTNPIADTLIDNLMGTAAGSEKKFQVAFPADYANEAVRGKTVEVTASIHAVKEKKLPELDDEFAKDFEFESLDKMRETVTERIKAQLEEDLKSEAEADFLETLRKENPVPDLPETLIEEEYKERLDRIDRTVANFGSNREQYFKMRGENPEEALKTIRRLAAETVHSSLLLLEIAEAEKIEVTTEDFAAEISMIAHHHKMSPEVVMNQLKKNNELSEVRNVILKRKSLQFLLKNAEIVQSK